MGNSVYAYEEMYTILASLGFENRVCSDFFKFACAMRWKCKIYYIDNISYLKQGYFLYCLNFK